MVVDAEWKKRSKLMKYASYLERVPEPRAPRNWLCQAASATPWGVTPKAAWISHFTHPERGIEPRAPRNWLCQAASAAPWGG
jgi:hypothetical protein